MTIELVELDPALLSLGANTRVPRPDKALIASIKERGVLQPIVAYRDGDQVVVLRGARRTLAAVTAKRRTVPVMVADQQSDVDRLVDQLSENDHRQGITELERIAAYQQLAALGVTPAQIARRTARARPEVDAALVVAASEPARQVLAEHPLTIEQAAVLVEFENDPAAVSALVKAAASGGFEHAAQRLRDIAADKARWEERERVQDELVEKTAAALREAGYVVVDEPEWNSTTHQPLPRLRHDGEPITEESHATCPGAAVYLSADWDWTDDAEEDDPGFPVVNQISMCIDYPANGHTHVADRGPATPGKSTTTTNASTGGGGPGDAGGEGEPVRSERSEVIAQNKAWSSAETVRRAWLARFLTRKTPPKAAAGWIAESIAGSAYPLRDALLEGHQLAYDLFGLPDRPRPAYGPGVGAAIMALVAGASEPRAQVVTLGMLLAAYEAKTGRHSWRTVDDNTSRYLRYLEAQGYELSDVERLACAADE